MNALSEKKCIIVADFEYHPMLFKAKNNFLLSNWKVFTKDDLLDRLSFSFQGDPIPFLLQHGCSYSNAKAYLRLLRVANIAKSPKLQEYYDLLSEAGFIAKDVYGEKEIANAHVFLFEMQEDIELHAFLERWKKQSGFDVPVHDLSFAELGVEPVLDIKNPPLLSFPNKFIQYFHIYSDIRKQLLEHQGESEMPRFTVLINDPSDIYYVRLASSLFKVPSFAAIKVPFLSNAKVKAKVNSIYQNKSFAFDEEEKIDPAIQELFSVVDRYGLDKLPFDFAYSCLLEMGNTLAIKETLDESGITIENRFLFNQDETIYVTNFQYDAFYKVFDDKNVASDAELVEMEANPSYVKTKLDRRKKWNYLQFNHIATLSRVRQHLTDKIYDSQFLEEITFEEDSKTIKWKAKVKKAGMNIKGAYTQEAYDLLMADSLDKQFYYGPYAGRYLNYDHSYTDIIKNLPTKQTYALTNLEQYLKCPFKYYLTEMLHEEDDRHAMWAGTLIHRVMEHVIKGPETFEEAFEAGVEKYKESVKKDGEQFTVKEESWLRIIKHYLRYQFDAIRAQFSQYADHLEEINEKDITFSLTDEEGNVYSFKGRIDKIVWSKNGNDRFYSIIDYKSGTEKFEPTHVFLGVSTQLPLYYYAIESQTNKDEYTGGGEFGGFGIQKSFASAPNKFFNAGGVVSFAPIFKNIKISGSVTLKPSYWSSIDVAGFKAHSTTEVKRYGGDIWKDDCSFEAVDDPNEPLIKGAKLEPNYNFLSLIEDAKQGTIDTIHKILRREFPIAPTSLDLEKHDPRNSSCKYCPYQDICYRRLSSDLVDYGKEVHDRFFPKKKLEANYEEYEEEDE